MATLTLAVLLALAHGVCDRGQHLKNQQVAAEGLARHNRLQQNAKRMHALQAELAVLTARHAEVMKEIERHRAELAEQHRVRSLRGTLPGDAAADAARAKRLREWREAKEKK